MIDTIFSVICTIISITIFIGIALFILNLCRRYPFQIIFFVAITIFGFIAYDWYKEYEYISAQPHTLVIGKPSKSKLHFSNRYKKQISFYYETILIAKPPKDRAKIIDMMKQYTDSIGSRLDSMKNDPEVYYYNIEFYNHNLTTGYFINNSIYDGGFFDYTTNLSDHHDEHLITIIEERSRKDSTLWNKYYQFEHFVDDKTRDYDVETDTIVFHD